MREKLKRDLIKSGLKSSAFHFEEFNMRSGLGLKKLISRLTDRFGLNTWSSVLRFRTGDLTRENK